jgi:hypothetical protein
MEQPTHPKNTTGILGYISLITRTAAREIQLTGLQPTPTTP